jgi:hypothetical protein
MSPAVEQPEEQIVKHGALVHNEVFTASGSRIQRTLDLSTFAKGSYTLLVELDGQRVSQAVVVE